MSKEFFIINSGRVVYAPGHYDREDAERIAKNAAARFPGRAYTVVERLTVFKFPKSKKVKT